MLAIKINNPEIENKLKEYAKKQQKSFQDVANEAMKFFLETQKKEDKLIFDKKDPLKNIQKTMHQDDGEDLSDVKLYNHVEDIAKYIHDLRRVNSR
ncbi:MAG: hypothetical protein WC141_02405 [Arcobacteraceae bacterium]